MTDSAGSVSDVERAREALRQIDDPELGVNIVDLGLVYTITFSDPAKVRVEMSMTSPTCPLGQWIATQAERVLRVTFPGHGVEVLLVWSPLWTPDRMSEAAKKQLMFE